MMELSPEQTSAVEASCLAAGLAAIRHEYRMPAQEWRLTEVSARRASYVIHRVVVEVQDPSTGHWVEMLLTCGFVDGTVDSVEIANRRWLENGLERIYYEQVPLEDGRELLTDNRTRYFEGRPPAPA